MSITDQAQRNRALDPTHSFIVQAPAGSGKTTLLVQRMLVLLAHAKEAPEEIVAITFTRKAAREMHDRLISALQQATEPAPQDAHLLKTWELARHVLERDRKLGWDLLEHPYRLRLQTIDSLCHHIVKQSPILSQFGYHPTVVENPDDYYLKATQALIAGLDEEAPWADALEELLLHLDNRHDRAERLLADMLAHRDQWLPHVAGKQPRTHLEDALKRIITTLIKNCKAATPQHLVSELLLLIRFAATKLSETDPTHPL